VEALSEQIEKASKTTGVDGDWEQLKPEQEADAYRVELPVFEGPLDLLLHLIRKHEIDIFDIPVSLITDKYLAYLEWMRVLDIDIASDFLVMAATLAHIKSRMLLPPEEGEGDEDAEDELDPREELVRRLLEYQRYKEAADELKDQPILNRDVFIRGTRTAAAESDSPFGEVNVFRLIEAFDRVLKKVGAKYQHEIVVDRVSIADRMLELADLLKTRQEIRFEDLFEGVRTRMELVATFLALLEMSRLRMLRLHQAYDSEVIHIRSQIAEDEDIDEVLSRNKLEV